MEISDALVALRALNLPPSRLAFLAAQLIDARHDDRPRIVYAARAEEMRNSARGKRASAEEYSWRAVTDARRVAQAAVTPQADPGRRRYITDATTPEHRPVRVTWTEPTKPDAVRPERRAEEISTRPAENWTPDRFARRTHGLPSTYNAGCRCFSCRDGYAEYRKKRQQAGT